MGKAKFWAAIIGSGITAALGVAAPDSTLFKVLTIAAAVVTAVSVYAVENKDDVNTLRAKLSAAERDRRV